MNWRPPLIQPRPRGYDGSMSPRTKEYKHVSLDAQDRPVIEGTRLKVRDLVIAHQAHGWSAEELVWQFSGLTLAQVHGALAFYYDHQVEIDADILRVEEQEEVLRQKMQASPLAQTFAQRKAARSR